MKKCPLAVERKQQLRRIDGAFRQYDNINRMEMGDLLYGVLQLSFADIPKENIHRR